MDRKIDRSMDRWIVGSISGIHGIPLCFCLSNQFPIGGNVGSFPFISVINNTVMNDRVTKSLYASKMISLGIFIGSTVGLSMPYKKPRPEGFSPVYPKNVI